MLLEYLLNLPPWQPVGTALEDYRSDGVPSDYVAAAILTDMAYSLVVGDLEPDMELTATVNDVAAVLTGALALNLRWKKPDNTISTVALTAVDLAVGKVKRVWVVGDTAQAGTHYGQIVVTKSNGELQTFPSDGSAFIWNVYPILA